MRLRLRVLVGTALAVGAAPAFTAALPPQQSRGQAHASAAAALQGIQKIRHVIIIMQENRSFDSYFGVTRAPTASR